MRDQLESFGIAEPDVRVSGENIIVDLPGVSDQSAAFDALRVSGIVELRPVLQCAVNPDAIPTGSTVPGATVPGSSVPATAVAGTVPVTSLAPTSSEVTGGDASGEESALTAGPGGRFPRLLPAAPPPTSTPTTSAPEATTPAPTTPDSSTPPVTTAPGTVPGPIVGPTLPTTTVPVTAPPVDTTGFDTLPTLDGTQTCILGPAGATGEVFERGSAQAGINPNTSQWVVDVSLRPDGLTAWNALAQQCNTGAPTCPTRQLAIVLDDVIQSAPVVQQPSFPDNVQISGAFEEDEVRSLARVLNRGAFPVTVEQQRVETVSPTAGEDSLRAAVIAGLIGIGVMLLAMFLYYRKLSVVILFGLTIWAMTVYVLATFVSNTWNFALTLAGVTGMIVAVGVTVDTYVVYFERIRDETRHGRSLVNAAPRSFVATWRTILAADLVSLLASFILFWLSVGSVKGFALYLGLTTICDLLVFVFVTRPAVYLLSQTKWLNRGRAAAAPATIGATS
jgi:preprotein translocase subunit SecD